MRGDQPSASRSPRQAFLPSCASSLAADGHALGDSLETPPSVSHPLSPNRISRHPGATKIGNREWSGWRLDEICRAHPVIAAYLQRSYFLGCACQDGEFAFEDEIVIGGSYGEMAAPYATAVAAETATAVAVGTDDPCASDMRHYASLRIFLDDRLSQVPI
jgi:hypothetical protein